MTFQNDNDDQLSKQQDDDKEVFSEDGTDSEGRIDIAMVIENTKFSFSQFKAFMEWESRFKLNNDEEVEENQDEAAQAEVDQELAVAQFEED
jgi:5-hydroxyisourate hydrolase-like protein (transthyretin family)